jgi:hypothetical protein
MTLRDLRRVLSVVCPVVLYSRLVWNSFILFSPFDTIVYCVILKTVLEAPNPLQLEKGVCLYILFCL